MIFALFSISHHLRLHCVMSGISGESVADRLSQKLTGTPVQQFHYLWDIIVDCANQADSAVEEVAVACQIIELKNLWKTSYDSYNDFLIAKDGFREYIDQHEANEKRIASNIRAITKVWGCDSRSILPQQLTPPTYGRHLLQGLRELSSFKSQAEAVELLKKAIASRLTSKGSRKYQYVVLQDVTAACRAAKLARTVGPTYELQIANESLEHEDQDIVDQAMVDQGTLDSESSESDQRSTSNTSQENRENEEHSSIDTEEGTNVDLDNDNISDIACAGQSNEDEEAYSEIAKDVEGHQNIADSQMNDAIGFDNECEMEEEACTCTKQMRSLARTFQTEKDLLSQLSTVDDSNYTQACRLHLRAVAKNLGLCNNISNRELGKRLKRISMSDLKLLKRREPWWFRMNSRPRTLQDERGIYRYAAVPSPIFVFNEKTIFARYINPDAWNIWQEDGSIVASGMFRYLEQENICEMIDGEFELYEHHLWIPPSKSRQGWMRNMFYSLIQQLVRQDPVWYALSVAARPDKAWNLISYPYITKNTENGENTEFLHLDINLKNFIDHGIGANLIGTSISLRNEDEHGCTVIVPGFHKHIREWHKKLCERGDNRAGQTTNCLKSYTLVDQLKWGCPIPQPCNAFDVRFTRPDIIHGSTPLSNRQRRTIFPWFIVAAADTSTISDTPNALNRLQIAACHRNLEIPIKEVTGQAPKHAIPQGRFPGAVRLPSVYALGDAITGQRPWDDPEVLQQLYILLGDDELEAWKLVTKVRNGLTDAYTATYPMMVNIEMKAFGADSYYLQREVSGLKKEMCDVLTSKNEDLRQAICNTGWLPLLPLLPLPTEQQALWKSCTTSPPRLLSPTSCFVPRPPLPEEIYNACKLCAEDGEAYWRGEQGDVRNAFEQIERPSLDDPTYAINFRPTLPDNILMKFPDSLHQFMTPLDDWVGWGANVVPKGSVVDFHVDHGQAGISYTASGTKIFMMWPPTPKNREVYRSVSGQKNRLGQVCDQLEGAILCRTDSSHCLYIPEGSLHSTITSEGGVLVGILFKVLQSGVISARCLSDELKTALDGEVDINLNLYLKFLKHAFADEREEIRSAALRGWIGIQSELETVKRHEFVAQARELWKIYLASNFFRNPNCVCGWQGTSKNLRYLARGLELSLARPLIPQAQISRSKSEDTFICIGPFTSVNNATTGAVAAVAAAVAEGAELKDG
ncbi:MAG: hypothetical protein M1824_001080 [Vezdaea acicularis]|nr:MAG: hypothetical protein M1824_001080 [Vezdaea acicularis]